MRSERTPRLDPAAATQQAAPAALSSSSFSIPRRVGRRCAQQKHQKSNGQYLAAVAAAHDDDVASRPCKPGAKPAVGPVPSRPRLRASTCTSSLHKAGLSARLHRAIPCRRTDWCRSRARVHPIQAAIRSAPRPRRLPDHHVDSLSAHATFPRRRPGDHAIGRRPACRVGTYVLKLPVGSVPAPRLSVPDCRAPGSPLRAVIPCTLARHGSFLFRPLVSVASPPRWTPAALASGRCCGGGLLCSVRGCSACAGARALLQLGWPVWARPHPPNIAATLLSPLARSELLPLTAAPVSQPSTNLASPNSSRRRALDEPS